MVSDRTIIIAQCKGHYGSIWFYQAFQDNAFNQDQRTKFMKMYFIFLLSVILISTIPASFAPSHLQVGGEQPIDTMETTSASSVSCERDSEGNLISFLAPVGFCGIQDGTIDCNNPIDYFHNSVACDVHDVGNDGYMNMIILMVVVIGIIIIAVIILLRRRK